MSANEQAAREAGIVVRDDTAALQAVIRGRDATAAWLERRARRARKGAGE